MSSADRTALSIDKAAVRTMDICRRLGDPAALSPLDSCRTWCPRERGGALHRKSEPSITEFLTYGGLSVGTLRQPTSGTVSAAPAPPTVIHGSSSADLATDAYDWTGPQGLMKAAARVARTSSRFPPLPCPATRPMTVPSSRRAMATTCCTVGCTVLARGSTRDFPRLG